MPEEAEAHNTALFLLFYEVAARGEGDTVPGEGRQEGSSCWRKELQGLEWEGAHE